MLLRDDVQLPDELAVEIFRFLNVRGLALASCVSREWRRVAVDDLLWARLARSLEIAYAQVSCFAVTVCDTWHAAVLRLHSGGRLFAWGSGIGLFPHEPYGVPVEVPVGTERNASRGSCGGILGVSAGLECLTVWTDLTGAGAAGGAVFACGFNRFGELGVGAEHISALEPTRPLRVDLPVPVVQAAVGRWHALYLTGRGCHGQLGHSNWRDSPVPKEVVGLRGRGIVSVSCGGVSSFAVSGSGTLWQWGGKKPKRGRKLRRKRGQSLDRLFDHPWIVVLSEDPFVRKRAKQLSARRAAQLCLCDDGEVLAWGNNLAGYLGIDWPVNSTCPRPQRIAGCSPPRSAPFVALGGGEQHSLAVTASGELYAWGCNDLGMLGLGDFVDRAAPVRVEALAGKGIVGVNDSCSCGHSLASSGVFCPVLEGVGGISRGCARAVRSDDGTLFSFGFNGAGQLGRDPFSETPRNIPDSVLGAAWTRRCSQGPHAVLAVAAGDRTSAAVVVL